MVVFFNYTVSQTYRKKQKCVHSTSITFFCLFCIYTKNQLTMSSTVLLSYFLLQSLFLACISLKRCTADD